MYRNGCSSRYLQIIARCQLPDTLPTPETPHRAATGATQSGHARSQMSWSCCAPLPSASPHRCVHPEVPLVTLLRLVHLGVQPAPALHYRIDLDLLEQTIHLFQPSSSRPSGSGMTSRAGAVRNIGRMRSQLPKGSVQCAQGTSPGESFASCSRSPSPQTSAGSLPLLPRLQALALFYYPTSHRDLFRASLEWFS